GRVWIATAISVFSRLFVWGAISPQRDTCLIERVIRQVRRAARTGVPILFAVDGFSAYPSVILRVFRDAIHTGCRGRRRLVVWSDLHIVQVIKGYTSVGGRKRLIQVERRLAYGCMV